MLYTVYKHTTPSNKVYIGITMQPVYRRWKGGKGYKTQKLFYNAIKHYGWENIKHEILFTGLCEEDAKQKEIELITTYNSDNVDYGYNITAGGDTSASWTKTARGKDPKTFIVGYNDRVKFFFRSQSEAGNYGFSQNAVCDCLYGRRKQHKGLYWRFVNETDEPVFDLCKPVPVLPKNKNKPIIATNVLTGAKTLYKSAHEAEKHGFNRANIMAVIKGKKLTHHGHKFAYADNTAEITQASMSGLELEVTYMKES